MIKIENIVCTSGDNVVIQVFWRAEASNATHKAEYVGKSEFSPENASGVFVPFKDLTEDLVVSWVKKALGPEKLAEIDATLQNNLVSLAATTVPALPWTLTN